MLYPNYESYTPVLRVKLLRPDVHVPKYQTEGAAGMDLVSVDDVRIPSHGIAVVNTGIAIALRHGFEAQIRSRSGLAVKHGIAVLNAPGTIDSDYRGEVSVILVNHGPLPFHVKPGDRIAQMVIAKADQYAPAVVEELDETVRGASGFGSTGVAA